MMMIDGLERYQAVKNGDGYIVQLNSRYSSTKHIVNGQETSMRQLYVESLDDIYIAPVLTRSVSHYSDGENEMSVEGYNRIMELCRAGGEWDDDSEEYKYPDIEAKIEALRLADSVKNYVAVMKEEWSEPTLIEFTVIGSIEPTGSAFISSSLSLGMASFKGAGLYQCKAPFTVALDEWKKLSNEFTEDVFDNATHSGLRFGKVNGKYLFSDSDNYVSDKYKYERIFTSLDDAKRYEQAIREFVRNKVKPHIKEYQAVSKLLRSELSSNLNSLLSRIERLHVKQKSETDWYTVKKQAKELIELLTKEN